MKCQICLRERKKLRFDTARLSICRVCVDDLNSYGSPAEEGYRDFESRLRKGLARQLMPAVADRTSQGWEASQQNFETQVKKALPNWLNKLAADNNAYSKSHKLVRAHRRNILARHTPKNKGYPSNWEEKARDIRHEDENMCQLCWSFNTELHVHHIIYRSRYGTNNKANLVTLCRSCHEKEHERVFDFGEYSSVGQKNHNDGSSPLSDGTAFIDSQNTAGKAPLGSNTEEISVKHAYDEITRSENRSPYTPLVRLAPTGLATTKDNAKDQPITDNVDKQTNPNGQATKQPQGGTHYPKRQKWHLVVAVIFAILLTLVLTR